MFFMAAGISQLYHISNSAHVSGHSWPHTAHDPYACDPKPGPIGTLQKGTGMGQLCTVMRR